MLAALSASLAMADDFKTNDGKEYKDATVTRVEADGIVVRTKKGISKLYFTELPKDVQERFHYDPDKAVAAQAAAVRQAEQMNRQAEEFDKQRKADYKEQQKAVAEGRNVQALADRLADLSQQEDNLLAEIGRVENAQEVARRKWVSQPWDGRYQQPYTDSAEANLPLLRGRLQNVRDEKERVRQELARAQRQP
jgi:hypothetical protein